MKEEEILLQQSHVNPTAARILVLRTLALFREKMRGNIFENMHVMEVVKLKSNNLTVYNSKLL